MSTKSLFEPRLMAAPAFITAMSSIVATGTFTPSIAISSISGFETCEYRMKLVSRAP
jgi:hypothetical protein